MKSLGFLLIGSALLFCIAPSADARGSWDISIGVGIPGVVYTSPPGYYPPLPAYYAPPSVYYAPPPIYYAPPAVVYYGPPAYYVGLGAGVVIYGHRGGHGRHGHRGRR